MRKAQASDIQAKWKQQNPSGLCEHPVQESSPSGLHDEVHDLRPLGRMLTMPKLAAGLLMYRQSDQGPEVLLVHPGGPFFKNKDDGVWSLPKGLADDGEVGEQLLEVAKREFEEETGVKPVGHFDYLGSIRRRSGWQDSRSLDFCR